MLGELPVLFISVIHIGFQFGYSPRANIKSCSPRRIYMVICSGEYIWLFAQANIESYLPIYIWLFARVNIYGYSLGRIYMVIRSGEYICMVIRRCEYRKLFARANIYMVIRPGEYIWLFARANIKSYSPGRIYIWLFAWANIYGYSPGRI